MTNTTVFSNHCYSHTNIQSPTIARDDRLRGSARDLAASFHLEHSLPDLGFATAVWERLVHLGRGLPEDQRPLPPRPWQAAELQLFLDFACASLQGARQGAGKTFVAALVVACHLLLGSSVTVAMPTYRQGSFILVRRVLLFMELLEQEFGLKRTRCNAHETSWDNGARLLALTTSSGGRRGTQGYTSRVVVIDESHELRWTDLAWFTPLVAMAMKQHGGRLLLLGVGARTEMAPMHARLHPGYASLVLDDATLGELDRLHRARLPAGHHELAEDSWSDFFAHERELIDEDYYRQFYMCESPGSGARKIFDRVPEMVGPATSPALTGGTGDLACGKAWHNVTDSKPDLSSATQLAQFATGEVACATNANVFLGVDVGKQRDQTVVAVIAQRGQAYNLVDCVRLPLGMPYMEQARELSVLARQWGCPPGSFAVEVNGPGQALYDVLTDPARPAIWNAVPVVMTTPRKLHAVARLRMDMLHGLFGVAEIPLRGSRVVDSGHGLSVGTRPAASAVGAGHAPPAEQHSMYQADNSQQQVRSSVYSPGQWKLAADGLTILADAAGRVPTAGDACVAPTGVSAASLYLCPTIRQHLAALSQFSTDDGVTTFDHSDILSALLVARVSMDGPFSV